MFKKKKHKENFKILGSQIKNVQIGLHLDQVMHKPDVVFVKSVWIGKYGKRFSNKPWKRKESWI